MQPRSFTRTRIYLGALFVLLTLLLLVQPSRVARANPGVIRVKTTGATSGTCGDQTDWSNACGLTYALTTVAVSGDEIWVASGTYTPTTPITRTATFQLVSGVAVYGGFNGTETARNQRDWTTNVVTLSGDLNGDDVGFTNNGENSWHVVTGADGATLDGVTISGGNANDSTSSNVPGREGGGMYNPSGSSPTLTNVTFSSNSAKAYGGGMYNASGSSPTLTNVTFSGNGTNDTSYGGGMYAGGNPTLTNVTFTNNFARVRGGGMYSSGNPTLTNATFSGNSTQMGGGMWNSYSNPTLTNVTFIGNWATSIGGAMGNTYSNPTLTNVTFSNNWANDAIGYGYGGAMYNSQSNPTLTNVTFSGNSAKAYGGVMYNLASNPTLTNVTFSGNSANYGGVMYNDTSIYDYGISNPTIRNSILWGNTAPHGSQIYNNDSTPPSSTSSISDSIVQGGCPTGSTCANIITTDPHLGALQNNGGATQTIALLSGSSAINAANPANCPATDQRGYARRTANGFCDIGAYEAQPYSILTSSGSGQATLINLGFASPLQATVSDVNGNRLGGVAVNYTLPGSGASANLSTNPAISNASGVSSANATANGIAGAYNVVANFAGGAFQANWGLANLKSNTTATITSSANPSVLGNAVTFTVTLTSPSGGTPSGTVDFYEVISLTAPSFDSAALRSGRAPRQVAASQTLVNGVATFTASSLTVGAHNLQAQYSGDPNYNASNSAVYSQVVNNPVPSISALNPTSANAGGSGFTLIVTGTNFVSGSVVRWNGVDHVTAFVSATRLDATISTTDIAASGTANVTVFNPTPGGGTSNTATFTINPTSSIVTLTSSCNPCAPNTTVRITATVTNTVSAPLRAAARPHNAIPSGTMTFKDNGNNITGCVNLALNSTGQAICATALMSGAHTITAQYSGDANFNPGSGTLTQSINYLLLLPSIQKR